jgi:hypothetical protein
MKTKRISAIGGGEGMRGLFAKATTNSNELHRDQHRREANLAQGHDGVSEDDVGSPGLVGDIRKHGIDAIVDIVNIATKPRHRFLVD